MKIICSQKYKITGTPETFLSPSVTHNIGLISGAHPAMVHEPRGVDANGRGFAVRCRVHRALLRPNCDLEEPVLLPLRVPFPCLTHPSGLLLPDLHCNGLLPIMWGGKSSYSAKRRRK